MPGPVGMDEGSFAKGVCHLAWQSSSVIFIEWLLYTRHSAQLGVKGGKRHQGEHVMIPAPKEIIEEGNGTPLQYSCLGNPMDRGAWRATVHGVAKSRTWLSISTIRATKEIIDWWGRETHKEALFSLSFSLLLFSRSVRSTFCNPMDCGMQASLSFTISQSLFKLMSIDAIQPSHPLSPASLPAFNLSQHQGLFQWVGSSH